MATRKKKVATKRRPKKKGRRLTKKQRSEAARKGWETRRKRAEAKQKEERKRKRAAAARKGWETRRKRERSEAARKGWETRRKRKAQREVIERQKKIAQEKRQFFEPEKPARSPRDASEQLRHVLTVVKNYMETQGLFSSVTVHKNTDNSVDGEIRVPIPEEYDPNYVLIEMEQTLAIPPGAQFSSGFRYEQNLGIDDIAELEKARLRDSGSMVYQGLIDAGTYYSMVPEELEDPRAKVAKHFSDARQIDENMRRFYPEARAVEAFIRIHWHPEDKHRKRRGRRKRKW